MTRTKKPQRVLLFDEHLAVREGVRALLEDTPFAIAGMAASFEELLKKLARTRFEVLLMDPRVGGRQDCGLLEEVLATASETAVLVYSESPHVSFVAAVYRSGARGFVDKRSDRQVLLSALQEVAEDEVHYSPGIAEALATFHAQTDHPQAVLEPQLFRIFVSLAAGRSPEEVGLDLGLTGKTVRNLVPRIKLQLGIEREQFYAHAERYGLVRIVDAAGGRSGPLLPARTPQQTSEPRRQH